jgi:hypothetical protein
MAWPKVTFNGALYYQAEGNVLVPVDPSTGAAILMLKENGGVADGFSAVEQGPPGVHAEIDPQINVTEIEADDPSALSWSWTTLVPPVGTTPGLYRLNAQTRKGAKGDDGASVWDPTDLSSSPVAGQIPAVKSSLDGFDLVAQKIPEVFYPGTINNAGSGNANFTMAQINIPSRPWARRVRGVGFTVITGEGADVRVNLLARLNGESGGNIVGRCVGITQTERLTMSPGKPIESGTVADTYDQIAAGATALLYIRTERQAGTTTYTASASSSQFAAEVWPL